MMETRKKRIVIDNSFLDSLYILNKVGSLEYLFSEVFIPIKVIREFLSTKNTDYDKRFKFLTDSLNNWKWFSQCNTYQNDIMKILETQKGLHKGEIEVIAQTRKLNFDKYGDDVISGLDEKKARRVAFNHNISLIGVLKFLAQLHSVGFLDYHSSVNTLLEAGKRFSSKIIKEVFDSTVIPME